MRTKKKMTLTAVLLLIGFVPLILSGVITCFIAASEISTNLEEATFEKLRVTADGLHKYYQYDLEQGNEIPYEHDYVDMMKDEDISMTVFVGDTRYMTSLPGDKDGRNEGTKMDAAIWAKVQAGEDVQSKGVNIGGRDFFVYYTPLYGQGKQVVGAAWAGEPEADVEASIAKVVTIMVIVVVVVTIIFGVIIFLVSKAVVSSIGAVISDVDRLSAGDLTSDDHTSSFINEINAIGDNVYGLNRKLKTIVGQAKSASDMTGTRAAELAGDSQQISDTSDMVSNSVQEMAKGAMDQADTVQKVTENLGMLSDAIQTVADNAEQLASSAAEMNDASMQSAEALQSLSSNMEAMGNSVNEIMGAMSATNTAVQNVNDKVDGITSIASQTNLLALNASIEAARAGEAGRGFAVVAEEIGKLAQESAQTAQEIRDEMTGLLRHSQEALSKTTEITGIKENVDSVLLETTGRINNLIDNVGSTVEGVNTISGLTEECNASKEQIVDAMSSLSAISEENAASTQETGAAMQELNATVNGLSSAAGSLHEVAEKLNTELGFFKVED